LFVRTNLGATACSAIPSGSDPSGTFWTSAPLRFKTVTRNTGARLIRKRYVPVGSKTIPSTSCAAGELSVANVVEVPATGLRLISEQVAVKRQFAAT
jgi:hypothetical protein